MAPKIEFVSTPADRVRADLLAVPVLAAQPKRAAGRRANGRKGNDAAAMRLGPGAEQFLFFEAGEASCSPCS